MTRYKHIKPKLLPPQHTRRSFLGRVLKGMGVAALSDVEAVAATMPGSPQTAKTPAGRA